MTTRVIRDASDLTLLVAYLKARKRPYTVEITAGAHRSLEQNALQHLWIGEVAEQLGDQTPEEVRGYCKLHFGVPLLRAENEKFREVYDRLIRRRPYEEKLELMMVPLDLPVTRIMTVDQLTRYLDAMSKHWVEQGIKLTEPEEKKEWTIRI